MPKRSKNAMLFPPASLPGRRTEQGVATIFVVTIFSTLVTVAGVTYDLTRVLGQKRSSAQQASAIARYAGQAVTDAALSNGQIKFFDQEELDSRAREANEAAGYPEVDPTTGKALTTITPVGDQLVVQVGKPVKLLFLKFVTAGAVGDPIIYGSASVQMTIGN